MFDPSDEPWDAPPPIPSSANVVLTDEQNAAAERLCAFVDAETVDRPYIVMHGYAGVGKTVVLGHVARRYPWAWVCTLSGRAADVLRKKTGVPAMTIHSAFYKLAEKGQFEGGKDRLRFARLHEDGMMAGSVLFLDEVSMLNHEIANDLIRTGCRIVACGDPGQLPPIQGEQFFNRPDITLKHVHRQALDSPILRQAHWVRLGRGYHADGDAFRVVDKLAKGELGAADIVLCWRNATRQAVNHIVRRERSIVSQFPQPGEPVMCLRNCQEHGLYNGSVYELAREFRDGANEIYLNINGMEEHVRDVRFEGFQDTVPKGHDVATSFAFAYGSTVHKAQGAEYSNVILIDEYARDDGKKQFLYTALTRAIDRITIVKR